MKKYITAFLLSFILVMQATAQTDNPQNIKDVMQAQIQSWNTGDIDGFMQTYWNNDSLVFVGKNGVTYGWQQTLDNYKKNYPDKAAMGTLKFDLIKIDQLSPEICNVIGKWHLTRTIGNIGGHFTLLFKKIDGKWLIVQDHSS